MRSINISKDIFYWAYFNGIFKFIIWISVFCDYQEN